MGTVAGERPENYEKVPCEFVGAAKKLCFAFALNQFGWVGPQMQGLSPENDLTRTFVYRPLNSGIANDNEDVN